MNVITSSNFPLVFLLLDLYTQQRTQSKHTLFVLSQKNLPGNKSARNILFQVYYPPLPSSSVVVPRARVIYFFFISFSPS